MNKYHIAWAYLSWLTKNRLKKIEYEFWSLDIAYEKIDRKFLEKIGENAKRIDTFLERKSKFDLVAQEKLLLKYKTKILFFRDKSYPENLKSICDPPIFLYCQGEIKKEDNISLAVVWSRSMSDYWKQVAKEIIAHLSEKLTIVSWFASWIDTQAHEITLDCNKRTIGVLWNWLDIVYPSSNRGLRDRILGGWYWALISEFAFWEKPERYNFPRRNRIIAWITKWTLVIEAKQKSWSLITARQALDYNREVFCIPWSVFSPVSSWTNEMIKKWEAKLVQNAEDIFEELNICKEGEQLKFGFSKNSESTVKQKSKFIWTDDEMKILSLIENENKDYSQIANEMWLPIPKISWILLWLELEWVVENLGMGVFGWG